MQKYNKPEMEIINLTETDIISTSSFTEEPDTTEKLVTWGNMSQNVNSADVGLFR